MIKGKVSGNSFERRLEGESADRKNTERT